MFDICVVTASVSMLCIPVREIRWAREIYRERGPEGGWGSEREDGETEIEKGKKWLRERHDERK
jgi:hypothetical protein